MKNKFIYIIQYPDFDIKIKLHNGIAFAEKYSKNGKPLPIILEEMQKLESDDFDFVDASVINGRLVRFHEQNADKITIYYEWDYIKHSNIPITPIKTLKINGNKIENVKDKEVHPNTNEQASQMFAETNKQDLTKGNKIENVKDGEVYPNANEQPSQMFSETNKQNLTKEIQVNENKTQSQISETSTFDFSIILVASIAVVGLIYFMLKKGKKDKENKK